MRLADAIKAPSFRFDAVCAQTDPAAFYPEDGGSTTLAKQVCRGCPVRAACLQYALDHGERYGVWGGFSERERRRIRDGQLNPATLEPFEPAKYTSADGHGYRGYKKGCKCGRCLRGYRSYMRDYQLRSGRQPRRCCTQCGKRINGSGRLLYCGAECKLQAKQQRAKERAA